MGETGTVTGFQRDGAEADVLVDTGGSQPRSGEHFEPAGFDSQPLPGDSAALQSGTGTGGRQALGYHDPIEGNKVADGGEGRVYGRNPDTGVAVCAIYCKNDGSIVIESLNGFPVMIKSTGPVTVDSPDVRFGKGGRQVACVGDFVAGSVNALSVGGTPATPVPIVQNPAPIPGAGVPFVGQIVSGVTGVEASTGDGSGE
jgi:hypothetical protein